MNGSERPPDGWDRLQELFETAAALPPDERSRFIQRLHDADAGLRDELASLLDHADPAGRYFDRLAQIAADAAGTPDRSPARGSAGEGVLVPDAEPGGGGRFRIDSELGQGGMGIVYRAFDTLLHRTVALKFLPVSGDGAAHGTASLIAEARAAAALDHPNVCAIHEIGTMEDGRAFLAMPCYDGETLKHRLAAGPLPLDEALDYAVQIARGLAAAHAAGLVHGDVKPGNVMITSAGVVKLLDFGIARVPQPGAGWPGLVPGTPAYMSPEQAAGHAIDTRSDLWALGVVLYEMLAGTRPFRTERGSGAGVDYDAVAPVQRHRADVSDEVAAVVSRLLERDPALRYDSADAVIAALEPLRTPARRNIVPYVVVAGAMILLVIVGALFDSPRDERIRSLAVLPLANFTGEAENDDFVAGLHDVLIAETGRVDSLRVIARQSVLRYASGDQPVRSIAAELGVDAIVEGSVLLWSDSIRITLQLVSGTSQRQLWSDHFQGARAEALAVQRDAARGIARALQVPAATVVPRQQDRAVNGAALAAYLRGLNHVEEDRRIMRPAAPRDSILRIAIASFEEAIRIEPEWAAAHAHLASAYHVHASGPSAQRPEVADDFYRRSKASALRAIELDPDNAFAHGALGFVLTFHEQDWEGGERALRRAVELDPGTGYQWAYAQYLQIAGRHDEAIAAFHRAEERNPLSESLKLQIAQAYACADRHAEAIEQMEEVRRRRGERADSITQANMHAFLSRRYSALGQHERAIAEAERAVGLSGYIGTLAFVKARAGHITEARSMLERLAAGAGARAVPELYAVLGDTTTAIAHVLSAYEQRGTRFALNFLCTDAYRALRDVPLIRELVRTTTPRS